MVGAGSSGSRYERAIIASRSKCSRGERALWMNPRDNFGVGVTLFIGSYSVV